MEQEEKTKGEVHSEEKVDYKAAATLEEVVRKAESASEKAVEKTANATEETEKKVAPAFKEIGPRGKLHSYNWLEDVPGGYADSEWVEVLFKNTRKGYYKNTLNLALKAGDMVAVEASPGHDIGRVSLTGCLVELRMKKIRFKADQEIKRIFRLAKPADIEKYEEAKARENDTMIRARKIAESLKLNMKIGDVEYQGDGNKAIFYYIAEERVDFRQLIKVLAETFHIRIEMKQIGARQEAGRIGGIGPCGRPLCCSSWMTNFVSVATSAARYQDISLNPQKLAGQCAKLKCCLNFEIDSYVESVKKMPSKEIKLETLDNTYYYFKGDVLKHLVTYSTDKQIPANLVTISASRAFEVIEMNKAGEKPETLGDEPGKKKEKKEFGDLLVQDDLTRFDKAKKRRKKNKGQKGGAAQAQKAEGENAQPQNAEPKAPKNQNKPQQGQPQRNKKRKGQNGQGNQGQNGAGNQTGQNVQTKQTGQTGRPEGNAESKAK